MPVARVTKSGAARTLLLGSILACSLLGGLAGCSKGRPLHAIRSSGEQNLYYQSYDAAATDFREYLERAPQDHRARFHLGQALLKGGRPAEARKEFKIASDIEPLNDEYFDSFCEAMFQANERADLTTALQRRAHNTPRTQDWSRFGSYSFRMGHADEAEQAFLMAAKVDQGKSASVQRQLADFYGELGRKDKQVERLRMAYYLDPKNESLIEAIRHSGEIPGPTFGRPPAEQALAGVAAPTDYR